MIRFRKKGSLMLGMAGLIAMLFVLSAAIASQSMETYMAGARAEHNMQARAAAEGAVVWLLSSNGEANGTLELGNARMEISPIQRNGAQVSAKLAVRCRTVQRSYVARFEMALGDRLVFTALEKEA